MNYLQSNNNRYRHHFCIFAKYRINMKKRNPISKDSRHYRLANKNRYMESRREITFFTYYQQ